MNIDLRCPDCDADLGPDIEFDPGQEPYPTSNPDDPRYSNPGSAGYCEGYPDRCPKCGTRIDADWAYDQAKQIFLDKMEAAAEDAAERAYDDWKDRRYDRD